MMNQIIEPPAQTETALSAPTPPTTRHDGWTGERMATFCETLAETAVVAEACDAAGMGISGAYACRRRNPVFAAAWDAALTIARERLADTLLARSMEGNVEQIWRDGELVGERHVIDNRLGLAILKRLDRLAETGMTVSNRGERYLFSGEGRSPGQRATAASQRLGPRLRREAFDWELAVTALRTGDETTVCKALALFEQGEVEEVHGHPDSLSQEDKEDEGIDLSERTWKGEDGRWMTDFPPPPGFAGHQSCHWGDPDESYRRECTPGEADLLDADRAAAMAGERAEEESLRDCWFAMLREELAAGPDPGVSAEAEPCPAPPEASSDTPAGAGRAGKRSSGARSRGRSAGSEGR